MTDKLIIKECPAAFEEFARKHNGLVYLIQSMRGVRGITVNASDSNILIATTGRPSITVGDPWHSVGSDGKLGLVQKHPSWTAGTTYPTALGVVTGSVTWTMDAGGFLMTNASSKTCSISFASITANMCVREIDVCDGTTAKKMLILASAPY
jgi:hypothetical protein